MNNVSRDVETTEPLTVKLRRRDLFHSFIIWETTSESCLSYERLMSLGFCHAMVPIINRLYHTKEEKAEALERHMVFFNTENNWGAFIPGLVASMEEERAIGGPISGTAINSVKIGLMGPLAGIGDTITQGLVKTVLLAIFVDMTLGGNTSGPIFYFFLFLTYLLAMGMFSFSQGYIQGKNVLSKITDQSIMRKITNSLSILGLTIAGAMMVNNVNIVTPLVIKTGTAEVVIQDLFNEILPGFLSVITVVGAFLLLKKNVNVFKVMLALFGIAIIGSLIGFL